MTEEGAKEPEIKKHTYPLVKNSDMTEEMRTETVELVVTACEKFSGSNESTAIQSRSRLLPEGVSEFYTSKRFSNSKLIKETMDKKFGSPWNVIVGEGFGFEVTYHLRNMLYMFFGGNVAVVIWKCA